MLKISKSKNIIKILVIVFMLSSLMNVSFAGGWDLSTASNWAKEEMEEAFIYDLIPSRLQGDYQKNITRAEFASLAVKLYESMTQEITMPASYDTFTDTNDEDVLKVYKLGIVSGKGNGIFAPDELINREQMACMYYKTLDAVYKKAGKSIGETDGVLTINDKDKVSNWAKKSVDFVYDNQIIVGNNGKFNPKGNATRQEAIIIVKRVFEKYKVEPSVSLTDYYSQDDMGIEGYWSDPQDKSMIIDTTNNRFYLDDVGSYSNIMDKKEFEDVIINTSIRISNETKMSLYLRSDKDYKDNIKVSLHKEKGALNYLITEYVNGNGKEIASGMVTNDKYKLNSMLDIRIICEGTNLILYVGDLVKPVTAAKVYPRSGYVGVGGYGYNSGSFGDFYHVLIRDINSNYGFNPFKDRYNEGYDYYADDEGLYLTFNSSGKTITAIENKNNYYKSIKPVGTVLNKRYLVVEVEQDDIIRDKVKKETRVLDVATLKIEYNKSPRGEFVSVITSGEYKDNIIDRVPKYKETNDGSIPTEILGYAYRIFSIEKGHYVAYEIDINKYNQGADVSELAKEGNDKVRYTIGKFYDETINGTYIDYGESIAVVIPKYKGLNITKGLTYSNWLFKDGGDKLLSFAVLGKIEDLIITPVFSNKRGYVKNWQSLKLGTIENEIVNLSYKKMLTGVNTNPDPKGIVNIVELDQMSFDIEYKVAYPNGHKEIYRFTLKDGEDHTKKGPYISPFKLPF